MKHTLKITLIILAMFLIAQLIGLFVASVYSPEIIQAKTETGEIVNITNYNLPFGLNPPGEVNPQFSLISIAIAILIAAAIMLLLIKFRAELIMRLWFFFVVTLALAITINATIMHKIPNAPLVALAISLPFGIIKIFQRNIIIHNITELLIYPGIAVIFIPMLNVWTAVVLLVLISIYDIYAVWHAGFMQKMAKYQINKVKVFGGFFVPYIKKKDRELIANAKSSKNAKSKLNNLSKKIKINVAILGGGDVVFPIILAGVVLNTLGLVPALMITLSATLALGILLYFSEKGKFYPAMPFISAGCFVGLIVAYLI